MLSCLFFIPTATKTHGLSTFAKWSLAFLALALSGLPIGLNERLGGWPGRILGAAALLTPVWSLLLFRRFGHWLARPFLWRDLSDLQLSSRVRTALVFLKWTAILPGGGLAIPVWITLRSFLDREFRQARMIETFGPHASENFDQFGEIAGVAQAGPFLALANAPRSAHHCGDEDDYAPATRASSKPP